MGGKGEEETVSLLRESWFLMNKGNSHIAKQLGATAKAKLKVPTPQRPVKSGEPLFHSSEYF